jgi:hypothetical protein
MNKKIIAFCIIAAVVLAGAFADKKAQYKVESVTGKVTYQVSNNDWAEVTSGMALDEGTMVKTGLNSQLVVLMDGIKVIIKPMKTGKLGELVALASSKSSVKVGSKVTKAEVSSDAVGTTKATATASSRASEAKEDVEWDE